METLIMKVLGDSAPALLAAAGALWASAKWTNHKMENHGQLDKVHQCHVRSEMADMKVDIGKLDDKIDKVDDKIDRILERLPR